MASFYRLMVIILTVFLIPGCSLSNTKVAENHKINLPPVPYYDADIVPVADIAGYTDIDNGKAKDISTDIALVANAEAIETPVKTVKENKPPATRGDADNNAVEAEKAADVNDEDLLDAALENCDTAQALWSGGNHEKAIDALDEAYQLVLRVDTDSNPELIRQTEDLRFTISKRILEIYTSRFTTANGNHKEIPLTMNEYVEREIRSFQGPEREFFMEGYKRSGRYRGEIVKSLKEAGLPEELSWLPFIESWFKVGALSPARALGIWQFIPSTGYKFGLKRDNWIDERMDPRKSTAAAIAYLKELHRMFGDWTTVLASYNCGEGNVLRVIRNQKIMYLDNFWDLYQRLPRETARYVPRFLATLHIMKDPAKYGFTLDELYSPVASEGVVIEKQVPLKALADNLGLPVEDIVLLNPELRRQITPPTRYSLNVPPGQGTILLSKLDAIPVESAPVNQYDDYIYHKVKRGDTLYRIASRYHTSVETLVKLNKISRKRHLTVGQKLRVPLKGGKSSDTFTSENELLPGGKYRTKRGESLWTIAKKFNTDTSRLKKLNRLSSNSLFVGQVIRVVD
ncbi:MAG: LysM peptidoglycan-binding domain-containing protein [Nitrospiraceae bacterium]|nr:MAG: LysM peptidoglycan-binding domain-containing protein [Nitrospiraceae bacterium]